MRAALAILILCAACFGGAFAVGSMTRDRTPRHPATAAPAVAAPAPTASLAPADRLPALRAVPTSKRPRPSAPAPAPTPSTVAVAARPLRAPAPAPTTSRRSGGTPAPQAPTSGEPSVAASGPSVTFFDEGN
jgi:hypothetical protein